MTRRNAILLILTGLLLGAALFTPSSVLAQDPQPTPSDNEVNRLAKEMYCPVCENIPLDVCPTQACQEWRALIRLRLSQGWSDEQIKEYFVQQYGDRVLAEPPARGLNLLVYILPVVAFLIGAGIVVRVITSMRRNTQPVTASDTPPAAQKPSGAAASDDPYLAQIEEELKKKE